MTSEALGNFTDYVNGGGRVLATHFSYTWLFQNGSFGNIGTWTTGGTDPAGPLATDVVTSCRGAPISRSGSRTSARFSPIAAANANQRPHANLAALAAGADLWLSTFSPPARTPAPAAATAATAA